jgi:glutamate receptor, ionotropic, invertebrate
LTRKIKFDEYGHRSDFLLDIIELTHEGIKKVGSWDRVEHLKMNREPEISNSAVDDGTLRNKTFIVVTVIVSKKIKLH